MEKIWYISINNTQEGPYSLKDLRCDSRITPDTLAWREGFPRWIRMGDIPELKNLFKDEEEKKTEDEPEKPKVPYDQLVLAYQQDPNTVFWIIITLIALLYFLYRYQTNT